MNSRVWAGVGAASLFFIVSGANAWQDAGSGEVALKQVPPQREPLPELVTDRPDFTESTVVVRPGVFQVEMGTTLDREGLVRHLSHGELLLRTGLTRRVELRFGGGGLLAERDYGESWRRGISDAEVGLKIKVWEERQHLPAFSLLPLLLMPTGARAFSSGSYQPILKFACSKDLPASFTLGGNVNLSSLRAGSGRLFQKAYSASLGRTLVAGFTGFWEVFQVSPWDEGTGSSRMAHTGVSHRIGRNAEMDVRVGKRMTAAGPNWFVGVGFAFRQPTRLFMR